MPGRNGAGLGMDWGELARRARHVAAVTPIAACLCLNASGHRGVGRRVRTSPSLAPARSRPFLSRQGASAGRRHRASRCRTRPLPGYRTYGSLARRARHLDRGPPHFCPRCRNNAWGTVGLDLVPDVAMVGAGPLSAPLSPELGGPDAPVPPKSACRGCNRAGLGVYTGRERRIPGPPSPAP